MSVVHLICHLDKADIKHSVFIYTFLLRLHSLKKLWKNLWSGWSIFMPLIHFSLEDSDTVEIFPWKSLCFLLCKLSCFPNYNKPCFISSSMKFITLSEQLPSPILSWLINNVVGVKLFFPRSTQVTQKMGVTTFHCKVFSAIVIIDLYINIFTY